MDQKRNRSDLIETFKIINGMHDVSGENYFQMHNSYHRGHSKKLFKMMTRLHVRRRFSNRVVNNWNTLSDKCINCLTVYSFKIQTAHHHM